mmetsp:Transcript_33361/g.80679  ORF Transcript_33361/g.80679 Transcript_33361/m.80679 type:complete len:110 (-) Transcript_33361:2125-2454(-)
MVGLVVGLIVGSLVGPKAGNGVDGIGFNTGSVGSDTTTSVTLFSLFYIYTTWHIDTSGRRLLGNIFYRLVGTIVGFLYALKLRASPIFLSGHGSCPNVGSAIPRLATLP